MKALRFVGMTTIFLSVVLGWVFVIGILRYGSVEDFGLRVRCVAAMSQPPSQSMLPRPAQANTAEVSVRLTALPPAPTKTPAAQRGPLINLGRHRAHFDSNN